ncbi:helix-turn-helix domain-containing protein [Amedibacillus sp. YH-ame6]
MADTKYNSICRIITQKGANYMTIIKFNKNVKFLRCKLCLSKKELSNLSGISEATLCEIEKGIRRNPTLSILIKLSNVLDVTIDELVKGDLTKNVPVTCTLKENE